jgi:hypothetical protein
LLEIKALGEGRREGHPTGSLRWNAQKLLTKGEMSTIKEVADRIDGRVAYKMGGDDELDPVKIHCHGRAQNRTGRVDVAIAAVGSMDCCGARHCGLGVGRGEMPPIVRTPIKIDGPQ